MLVVSTLISSAAPRAGHRDLLDQVVNGEGGAFEYLDVADPDVERAAGEDLLERLAHRMQSDQPLAAGMDADDFLVVGPERHDAGDVGVGQGGVEGFLHCRCGSEDQRSRHAGK